MKSKVVALVKSISRCKLYLMKEPKLRTKLIKLNCALATMGLLTVEATNEVEYARLADIEASIVELQDKVKEMIVLNEMV
jgi:hypothetical protein